MRVADLFERLSYGELSNLSIGMEGAGTIAEHDQPKVISFINAALSEIYSKFAHNRHYVKLNVSATRVLYQLRADDPAIETLDGDPFPNDVLKVLAVTREDDPTTLENETLGLKINARNSAQGVRIMGHDRIRVSAPKQGDVLLVEYRPMHTAVGVGSIDLEEEILIAPPLENALEMNVSARIFSGMNGEGNMVKARELWARFNQACDMVDQEDLVSESETNEFDKLHDRGFV